MLQRHTLYIYRVVLFIGKNIIFFSGKTDISVFSMNKEELDEVYLGLVFLPASVRVNKA